MDPRQDERLADWLDDRMDPRERERFEAEMRVNAELREAADDYASFRERMREALGEDEVPDGMADRIMDRLDDGAPVLRIAPWVGSAVAAAALVLVFFALRAWSDDGVERETVVRDSVEPKTVDELREGAMFDRTVEAPTEDSAGEAARRKQFSVPPVADPEADPDLEVESLVQDLRAGAVEERNKNAKGRPPVTKPAGGAVLRADGARQLEDEQRDEAVQRPLEDRQPAAPTPSRRGAPGAPVPGAGAPESAPATGAAKERARLARRFDAEPDAADDKAAAVRALELEELADDPAAETQAVRKLLEQGAADSLPVVVFALPALDRPTKKVDKDAGVAADERSESDAWREFSQDLAQAPIDMLNERKVPAPRLRVEQPVRARRAVDDFYLGANSARQVPRDRAGLDVAPFTPQQDDVVFELQGDAEQVGTYLKQLSTLTRESRGSIGYQWVSPEQMPSFRESRFAADGWVASPRREAKQRLPKSFEDSLRRLRTELKKTEKPESSKSAPTVGRVQGKSRGLTSPKEQRVLIVVRRQPR